MFLEWENNSRKLQNNAINDVKQISLSHVIKFNARVYNLISVPQIKRLFLEDATILSKIDPRSGSKKERRSCNKVSNNKIMSTILSFISVLYLKHRRNILPCFCSLKFEKKVYLVIIFSVLYFTVRC